MTLPRLKHYGKKVIHQYFLKRKYFNGQKEKRHVYITKPLIQNSQGIQNLCLYLFFRLENKRKQSKEKLSVYIINPKRDYFINEFTLISNHYKEVVTLNRRSSINKESLIYQRINYTTFYATFDKRDGGERVYLSHAREPLIIGLGEYKKRIISNENTLEAIQNLDYMNYFIPKTSMEFNWKQFELMKKSVNPVTSNIFKFLGEEVTTCIETCCTNVLGDRVQQWWANYRIFHIDSPNSPLTPKMYCQYCKVMCSDSYQTTREYVGIGNARCSCDCNSRSYNGANKKLKTQQ